MQTTDKICWEHYLLPNIPIYQSKLPQDIMDILWKYVDRAKENFNGDLAGNISKSLVLEDEDEYFFKKVVAPIATLYISHAHSVHWVQQNCTEKMKSISLSKFWVNFQKQNEFNPAHDHTGLISFVIWMKIPTEWRDQHALPICANSNSPSAGDFQIHYSDMLGNHKDCTFNMGKEAEGTIIVFPSQLRHQVYPFYNCEEERVSISGNVAWEVKND